MERIYKPYTYFEPGVKCVNELEPNKPLTKLQIQNLSFKINDLKAYEYQNGQILWVADGVMNHRHLKSLITLYKKLDRSLHINIGTHGSEDGTIVGPNNPSFAHSLNLGYIFGIINEGKNSSVHIVSSYSGPIYPDGIDIFLSWCFSEKYYLNNYKSTYSNIYTEKKYNEHIYSAYNCDIPSKYVQYNRRMHSIERPSSSYDIIPHLYLEKQPTTPNHKDSTTVIPTKYESRNSTLNRITSKFSSPVTKNQVSEDSLKKRSFYWKRQKNLSSQHSSKQYPQSQKASNSYSSQIKSSTVPMIYIDKGNKFYDDQYYHSAIKQYDLAISFDSNIAQAYFQKGNALVLLGKYKEGIQSYELAIEKDSKLKQAYKNKFLIQGYLQNWPTPFQKILPSILKQK